MKKFASFLFKAVLCIAVVYLGIYAGNRIIEEVDPWNGTVPVEVTEYGSPHKFYYNRLSDKEKHAYNEIITHIYDMPESIRIPAVNDAELSNVFSAILHDNPDLFFIGRKCSLTSNFLITECSLEYTVSKSEYAEMKAELNERCHEILSSLSNIEDDWQTELEIHDSIIKNCEYKLEEGNYICSSSYGALVNGEAACEGYSKAAKLLFDLAGMESAVVSGQSESNESSGPHMWNVVKIYGDYYHLDCTWNDAENQKNKDITDYAYFNLTDDMIKKTHSNFSYYFNCESTKANYHIKKGRYFESYDRSNEKTVADITKKTIDAGGNSVSFRLATEKEFNNAVEELVDDGRFYDVIRRTSLKSFFDVNKASLMYYGNPDQYVLTFIIEV